MRLDRASTRFSTQERRIALYGVIALLLILVPSVYGTKSLLIHSGYVAKQNAFAPKMIGLARDLAAAPINLWSADRNIPVVQLDIKYADWLQLDADRKTAFQLGSISSERKQVNAQITHGRQVYRAKARLHGDMLDHVDAATRWSLRLEIKKGEALFSARRFSLVSSHVRVHQGWSMFDKTLQVAGYDILSPKHKPVRVIVNGADWGVMLFEEAFSQSLLAVNERTEGLIVRLDLYAENTSGDKIERVLKPRVSQAKTVLADSSLGKQRKIALQLLADFISGERKASDVFDSVKLGQYLATADIWGAWHALAWNNWRWYYNPHTARLEPIQSDVGVTPGRHMWLFQAPSRTLLISKKMLEDPVVEAHYLKSLAHLKTLVDAGDLSAELERTETEFLSKLHGSAPLTAPYDLDVLREQMDCVIEGYENPPCSTFPTLGVDLHENMTDMSAHANWDLASSLTAQEGAVILEVVNNDRESLNLSGITAVNRFGGVDLLDDVNSNFPQTVAAQSSVRIALPIGIASVVVRGALASSKMADYEIVRDVALDGTIPRATADSDISLESLRKYPFIQSSENTWQIPAGEWQINDYLRTPDNWRVIVDAGAKLTFAAEGGLIVFGELLVNGTKGAPVVFGPQGEVKAWSGFAVFGTLDRRASRISHLEVNSASSPKLGLWQPRGASFFYDTQLSVDTMKIDSNVSEDALNIINSDVEITGLRISNSLSDAFDCDFCTGTVRDSEFSNIGFRSGGDGIDVSGSELTIDNVQFTSVRDKAVSGGERSHLTVTNTRFSDVNFGLVAKDDTQIVASDISFERIKHKALMSYSKKSIFGPARLQLNRYTCDDAKCDAKFAADIGSQLSVNGAEIETENLDVESLYDTVMKSDKPK